MILHIFFLEKYFNSHLLLYSSLFIKNQFSSIVFESNKIKPISYKWCYKISNLIRKGLFDYTFYSNKVNIFSKNKRKFVCLKLFKLRVIEFSFIFLLIPFFPFIFLNCVSLGNFVEVYKSLIRKKFFKFENEIFISILVHDFSLFKLSFSRRFLSNVFFDSAAFIDRLFYSARFISLFNQKFFSLNITSKLFSYISRWYCLDFFVRANFFTLFNLINVNRLKNLFLKKVGCNRLWEEIFKMINVGLVNFSNFFILEKKSFLESSFISIFLLEIYLFEFDLYLLENCFNLSSVKSLIYDYEDGFFSLRLAKKNSNFFNLGFFPSRVDKHLVNFINLNFLNSNNVNTMSTDFLLDFKTSCSFFFVRYFYYARYKNHLIIGFKGSRNFFNLLKSKLSFFVRSNLNMEISFSSISSETFFLGYIIKSNISQFNNFNSFKNVNNFTSSRYKLFTHLLSKLEKLKNKVDSLIVRRLQSEFLTHINVFLLKSNKIALDFKDKKFWISVFQLEVLRSSQTCKLVTSNDSSCLLSANQLDFIKFLRFNEYRKYIFNIYLYKCRNLFSDISTNLFPFVTTSFYPNDFLLSSYFSDLKKKLFLTSLATIDFSYSFFSTQFNGSNKDSNLHLRSSCINFFVPFNYIFSRLRNLGFLHFKKCRPISNVKYLTLTDKTIIKTYGLMSYSFIFWYRFSNNFEKIRILILLLRQSCFLTLCRKHNKSRSWTSKVYTYDLVLSRGLFNCRSFFPSTFFINKNYLFYFKSRLFLINEQFFLDVLN
uniref:Maturase n=1 Tax=Trachelomonas volvocina TaxID=103340 RepID=A0A0G3VPZ3_9EUGL|nr:maturase [Trachelomonas volvocina]AKL82468.1 maturase [Trachelomonas volvocina]